MDHPSDEDIILGAWNGDRTALGQLVMKHFEAIECFIAKRFPTLACDAEDVAADAVRRFWEQRDKYDATRPLKPFLCGLASNEAMERVACRRSWQKSRDLEVGFDPEHLGGLEEVESEEQLDRIEERQNGLLEKLNTVLNEMNPLYCEIYKAFAFAGDIKVDAGELGRELGEKFKDGVPIPAGTIRQYKMRARNILSTKLKELGIDLDRLE